jgi:hypothetical protein
VGIEVVRAAVLGKLRSSGRWLLVFDNAEKPDDIRGWLPGGGGHVLITSREHGWTEVAAPVEVDMLTRSASVEMLQNRVTGLATGDADQLADQLGDLPLAIAQAAGFMAETGTPANQYLSLLRTRAGQLLGQATPTSHQNSLAAASGLIADMLANEDPAAAELADVCAFMAPELIPEDLFTTAATALPGQLSARAADPLAWRQTLAHLAHQALVRVDQRGLVMHRLTQAILRSRLTPVKAAAARQCSEAVLTTNDPGNPDNPATWPKWAILMPHLLAADLAAADDVMRPLACKGCWYLITRGDTRTGYDLANDLRQQWRARLGDDHNDVGAVTIDLCWALREMGRNAEAHDLAQEGMDRYSRSLGRDDLLTLRFAGSLATSLRALDEEEAARDLDQDTLDRRRRVLGQDHPETLRSARHLADDLRRLGEMQAARDLDQDTLERYQRIETQGENHPDTLRAATSLADDLRLLGEVQAAHDLDQDTLERFRQVMGQDHPDTLRAATNLADDLWLLGEVRAARDLDQDTLDRSRRVLGEDHPDTLRRVQAQQRSHRSRKASAGRPKRAADLGRDGRI